VLLAEGNPAAATPLTARTKSDGLQRGGRPALVMQALGQGLGYIDSAQ
jgi:hypothetical protein